MIIPLLHWRDSILIKYIITMDVSIIIQPHYIIFLHNSQCVSRRTIHYHRKISKGYPKKLSILYY